MTTPIDDTSGGATSHFLRQIIERDLELGTYKNRHFAGTPGDATHHAQGPIDWARVRLRFPPEPNGYLHIGHAKSICLNFGLARDYGGVCHLRFDDTNPDKEEQEYVDAIIEAVQWLGFSWIQNGVSHLYYASNYFDFMYKAALSLIDGNLAYVDEQSAQQIRENRGDFKNPGVNSPYRDRPPSENRARFEDMRSGRYPDGSMVLRAKIDMASPNINLRDPAIYRIKHATHHNTGDRWCIYPMYTFAHPVEDALENITHSLCTLEFEDQRPFYDWVLQRLAERDLLSYPLPQQYEFGRLNLTTVVTSKRKLRELVEQGFVNGWNDPRMPTIFGLRRRGYTAQSIRAMADATGASKTNIWVDYSVLDAALRADLEERAPRAMAVLDPIRLHLTNWTEVFGEGHLEPCQAPRHPHHPEWGSREFSLGPDVWIDRDDFQEVPEKGFFRLYSGNKVRLKYGIVIECTGFERNDDGTVSMVLARVIQGTKSGSPGADSVKVKGTITWLGAHQACNAEFRLFEPLFTEAQPDSQGLDLQASLNPNSKRLLKGYVEQGLMQAALGDKFQFERHGYFVADEIDHTSTHPVFNRITPLRENKTR
jgi:glutaminyl-tRNA synthetase